MGDEKKKPERKPIKVGTHGHVIDRRPKRAPLAEYVPPKPTLRATDPAQWKAKKAVKVKQRDAERAAAKKHGHRMGAWVSGAATCKNKGCEATMHLSQEPDCDATKVNCGGDR